MISQWLLSSSTKETKITIQELIIKISAVAQAAAIAAGLTQEPNFDGWEWVIKVTYI